VRTPVTRPTTVVFDIGGVLLDWDPRYLYRKLLPDEPAVERFLTEVATMAWNAEQDRGRPWPEAVAELSARFPDHAELIAAYHERWSEMVGGPIAETVRLLRRLRGLGVPCYALTNFSTEKFAQVRDEYEFLGWFGGIVVSGDEKVVKPDPRIYRILLRRFGLDPAATVYVDDSAPNVVAARAQGMTGLHFTDPARLRAELTTLGVI
jgi:2-haloacid dehalogenase